MKSQYINKCSCTILTMLILRFVNQMTNVALPGAFVAPMTRAGKNFAAANKLAYESSLLSFEFGALGILFSPIPTWWMTRKNEGAGSGEIFLVTLVVNAGIMMTAGINLGIIAAIIRTVRAYRRNTIKLLCVK